MRGAVGMQMREPEDFERYLDGRLSARCGARRAISAIRRCSPRCCAAAGFDPDGLRGAGRRPGGEGAADRQHRGGGGARRVRRADLLRRRARCSSARTGSTSCARRCCADAARGEPAGSGRMQPFARQPLEGLDVEGLDEKAVEAGRQRVAPVFGRAVAGERRRARSKVGSVRRAPDARPRSRRCRAGRCRRIRPAAPRRGSRRRRPRRRATARTRCPLGSSSSCIRLAVSTLSSTTTMDAATANARGSGPAAARCAAVSRRQADDELGAAAGPGAVRP